MYIKYDKISPRHSEWMVAKFKVTPLTSFNIPFQELPAADQAKRTKPNDIAGGPSASTGSTILVRRTSVVADVRVGLGLRKIVWFI